MVKRLRAASGMSRTEFAEYFEIPYRTVQNWELGLRECPEYVAKLMRYVLKNEGLINEEDVKMAKISLDNGHSFLDAAEAMEEIKERDLWDVVVDRMDDEVREQVHADLAPCTDEEFLEAYLDMAREDLVIG